MQPSLVPACVRLWKDEAITTRSRQRLPHQSVVGCDAECEMDEANVLRARTHTHTHAFTHSRQTKIRNYDRQSFAIKLIDLDHFKPTSRSLHRYWFVIYSFFVLILCILRAFVRMIVFSFLIGMCGKPKFGSYSVFKNRTVQKFDIRSDGFPQFMLKVTNITLLAFKCAHKERFKHYRIGN